MSVIIPSTDQNELLTMLTRRHPEYFNSVSHWAFCLSTYEGERDWFYKNIFQGIKEGDIEFGKRVERSYRFNHTREVVDLIQKYIFKSDVARKIEEASPEVQAFWKACTLGNLNIDSFMKIVGTMSSILQRVWVWTDTNKTDLIQTKQQQKDSGARVYVYLQDPRDVLDFRWGKDGALDWVLTREWKRDDEDPFTSTGVMMERFRLRTRDAWWLYEITEDNQDKTNQRALLDQASSIVNQLGGAMPASISAVVNNVGPNLEVHLLESGINPIGMVPGFPVDHVASTNLYKATGLIDSIAYLDRATANYLSNLDAIIQDQTFSQLVMPSQGQLPGDDKYEAILEMGTKRMFLFDGESAQGPHFISPDVKQANLILEVVNKIINEIYHTVGAAGERTKQDNAVGIDNSSGVAKAYDFERLNALLTTKSASLNDAENRLVELVCLWNKDPVPDNTLVKYADTFDVRSLYDEFSVAERLDLIGAPDMVRQEQMKQVAEKLFPALSADLLEKMKTQITEDWPPAPPPVTVTGSDTGSPGGSFPAKSQSQSASGATSTLKSKQTVAAPPAPTKTTSSNRQGQVTSTTK